MWATKEEVLESPAALAFKAALEQSGGNWGEYWARMEEVHGSEFRAVEYFRFLLVSSADFAEIFSSSYPFTKSDLPVYAALLNMRGKK